MKRGIIVIAFVVACGARTGLGDGIEIAPKDAAIDAVEDFAIDHGIDASVPDVTLIDVQIPEDAPPPCTDYGPLVADVFGKLVFWGNVPAGHYSIRYTDGCFKYSTGQDWSVNAYPNGPDTLYVVTNGDQIVSPAPGTIGFVQGQGGFASFDDCVSANLQEDGPLEIDWTGGELGLFLEDEPYTDNVGGENGRNPTYVLSSCSGD